MAKNNRHGKATVLSPEDLEVLFAELPQPHRAIMQVCYYTASRVNEVCTLKAEDIVGETIVIQKAQTKTQQTKEAPIIPALREALEAAKLPSSGYLFPSKGAKEAGHRNKRSVDHALRKVCKRLIEQGYIQFEGVSTHSMRRSALTNLANAGANLREIQSISGHANLIQLHSYIEVSDARKAHVAGLLG